jgi:proline racemase
MVKSAVVRLTAIDAHAAGGVVRLVTGGFPVPRGRTIDDKQTWLARRHAGLCSALTLEPRGHDGIVLAVLCEPITAGADAGVVFRHGDGSVPLCGHGLIGIATIAIERRLIVPREPGMLTLDTAAGPVRVAFDWSSDDEDRIRVSRVRYVGPPSFVFAGGVPLTMEGRVIRADIAFGGSEFLVLADSEAARVPLARTHLADLRRAGHALLEAAEASLAPVHPLDAFMRGVGGVVFTGPPEGQAQLRCQPIYADGTADRSPSGTAVSGILAVFDAMGLAGDAAVTIESLAGTTMSGRVVEQVTVGPLNGVRVEVEASAWIVADHEFLLAPDDPLAHGIAW